MILAGDDIGNDDGDLDDCDDSDESCERARSSKTLTPAATATLASPTKASSASLTTAVTASATYIASTANATANSTIGGDLWAGGASSESTSGHSHHHHSGSSSSTDGSGASYTDASNSTTYATASSTAWGETSSETASATASITNNATSTSTTSSGYLQVSGTSVVDSSGKTVVLRGTNLGGWLVMEDWMCGISDESGSADRFSQTTLENRFGVDKTHALLNTWQDNWLVSSDFDNMAALGFNVVRLPFGFRNLQWANGSWITDSSGNVDFSRLDWAVALAKSRGIYVIPVFHIWQGQEQGYSTISEDSDEGKTQRAAAAAIWVKVATHFVGESGIAAFDAINEATGSANDNLQKALYKAIRSVDATRIIIMESIGTNPSNYGWTNVMYSLHEYLMMGSDVGYNKQQWNGGAENDINQWLGYGIPVYIGEFMADGSTLSWMLSTMNSANLWWSGWTYKTVNMGRWGLYNTGNIYVDVSSDSYSSINSAWSNLGEITKQAVASEYKSATSQRRSLAIGSPRAAQTKRFTGPHQGRSRRGLVHGGSNRF